MWRRQVLSFHSLSLPFTPSHSPQKKETPACLFFSIHTDLDLPSPRRHILLAAGKTQYVLERLLRGVYACACSNGKCVFRCEFVFLHHTRLLLVEHSGFISHNNYPSAIKLCKNENLTFATQRIPIFPSVGK